MAYIFDINSNTIDSHQTSPSWVVTFIRWNNRASSQVFDKDIKDKEGNLDRKKGVRGPLVVHSDAINISVQNGKTTVTPGCQIVLKGGDINYSTAISPGDYIFINILNSEQKANDVVKRANSLLPINRAEDGFKGIFKVKGCRRRLSIDGSGKKQLVYVCTGFAFTELNSDIYFNPYLFQQEEAKAIEFITALGKQWNSLISQKTQMLNQDIIKLLIQVFIGSGFSETAKRTKTGDLRNFNSTFLIPPEIKNLLGVKKAERVADITNIIMGVEKYSTKSVSDPQSTGDGEFTNYKDVFNPGIVNAQDTDGRFYETANKLQGNSQVKPEYWSQVKAWSILQQYLNAPMNECFTSFRIAPDSNKVMPTLTFRQIIFTKDNVKTAIPVTQYLSLPRWRIGPELILGYDLGRDESSRINFVQMFGRSTLINDQSNTSHQIALGNYVFDLEDVQRNGLKPYILSSNSDFPIDIENIKGTMIPDWKEVVANAVFDGHLRDSGTVQTVGIVDPIDIGMNMQIGSTVYHIEGYTHQCGIDGDGTKNFRSTFSLSHGIDERSNKTRPVYPEMVHTDAYSYQEEDYQFERFLPGVSDSQDTGGRNNGERVNGQHLKDIPFNPGVGKRTK